MTNARQMRALAALAQAGDCYRIAAQVMYEALQQIAADDPPPAPQQETKIEDAKGDPPGILH